LFLGFGESSLDFELRAWDQFADFIEVRSELAGSIYHAVHAAGMSVYWPKGIKAKGELRTQFHHVIDIAPTILEAAGLPEPKIVNGVTQHPMDGVSMV
jgi:arylsulfatase A-like enzyme